MDSSESAASGRTAAMVAPESGGSVTCTAAALDTQIRHDGSGETNLNSGMNTTWPLSSVASTDYD